jgi:hypothetical protein
MREIAHPGPADDDFADLDGLPEVGRGRRAWPGVGRAGRSLDGAMDRPPAEPPPWLPLPRPLEHPPALREQPAAPSDVRERPVRAVGLPERAVRAGWGGGARGEGATGAGREEAGGARKTAGAGSSEYRRTADGRPRAGWAEPVGPPPVPTWRRFVRTRRGAVGLGIVAAALLLWPFAGPLWIPWLAGFLALILLRLLRLETLLRGWDVHAAGLVVVAGMMISTTPWAWALAASIGVLIAGLSLLPAWRLAALGAVLCLLAGGGYIWSTIEAERAAVAAYAPVQERSRHDQGAPRANGVLPIMLNRIAQGSPDAICDNLLAEPVRAQFAEAAGQPDCDAAIHALAAQVTDTGRYADAEAPSSQAGDGLSVDACALDWGAKPAGPQLGHLTITAVAPSRYLVTGFRPCRP